MPPRKSKRLGRRDFGSVVADGAGKFTARWWEGSSRKAKRGFATRTEAQQFLARLQTAQADGLLDLHRKGQVTLAAVGAEWLAEHSAPRLRSHKQNALRWRILIQHFGDSIAVGEITKSNIVQFREALRTKRELGPAATNRYLALLRCVLSHAVTAGYLASSPIAKFRRGTYLSREGNFRLKPPLANMQEAQAFLDDIQQHNPEWFACTATLLASGLRRGEAAGLVFSTISFDRRVLTIRRSYDTPPKSGKERTVPMVGALCQILDEHRRTVGGLPSAYVFTVPSTGAPLPRTRWKLDEVVRAACLRLGIEPFRVHDLRHAYASLWLMNGGSLSDLQMTLGHSSPLVTSAVYGHLSEQHRITEAEVRMPFGASRG